jgi:PEGA domain
MSSSRPARHSLVLFALAALLAATSACNRGQKTEWEQRKPEDLAQDIDKRTVLFAPVAIGRVAEVHPEARDEFATNMARHVNTLVTDAHAWASVAIPPSDAAVWEQGPVGSAAGAHLVILTEVQDIVEQPGGPIAPGTVTASVRLRAINAAGQEVWRKNNLLGSASTESSPKFMHAGSHPISKAAWEASKKGIWDLRGWLNSLSSPGPVSPTPADPNLAPTLSVLVTSIPEGADILIDGVFRGNTPQTVPMPMQEVEVRIQRTGYQPWVRRLTATPEMKIQPALMPDDAPAAVPAEPVEPAPAP